MTDRSVMILGTRWHRLVAVLGVLILYTNLPRIVYERGVFQVPPFLAVVALGILSAPLLFRPTHLALTFQSPLVSWSALYLWVTAFGFFVGSQSNAAVAAVAQAAVTVSTLLLGVMVFADPQAVRAARRALIAATLFAVALNVYEVFFPGTFSLFLGRAAGFYLNPNIAGSAIVYGMVLSLEALPSRQRPWYAIAAGIGILATLSRSSLICWVVAVGAFALMGPLRPTRSFVITIMVLLLAVPLSVPRETLRRATNVLQAIGGSQLSRLTVEGAVVGSVSVDVRLDAMRSAWDMFASRPVLGHGSGATREWRGNQSTHNMYLKHMAEHGLLGILLYPCVILAAFWGAPREQRPLVAAFSAVWLCFGVFTHNAFENRHVLMALALAAAITLTARTRDRQRGGVPGLNRLTPPSYP